jgi:hypothetical protein
VARRQALFDMTSYHFWRRARDTVRRTGDAATNDEARRRGPTRTSPRRSRTNSNVTASARGCSAPTRAERAVTGAHGRGREPARSGPVPKPHPTVTPSRRSVTPSTAGGFVQRGWNGTDVASGRTTRSAPAGSS